MLIKQLIKLICRKFKGNNKTALIIRISPRSYAIIVIERAIILSTILSQKIVIILTTSTLMTISLEVSNISLQ